MVHSTGDEYDNRKADNVGGDRSIGLRVCKHKQAPWICCETYITSWGGNDSADQRPVWIQKSHRARDAGWWCHGPYAGWSTQQRRGR